VSILIFVFVTTHSYESNKNVVLSKQCSASFQEHSMTENRMGTIIT